MAMGEMTLGPGDLHFTAPANAGRWQIVPLPDLSKIVRWTFDVAHPSPDVPYMIMEVEHGNDPVPVAGLVPAGMGKYKNLATLPVLDFYVYPLPQSRPLKRE